jgi:hypothetical protein
VQIAKRRSDWGRDGFEAAVGAAWERCLPKFESFITVQNLQGTELMLAAYREFVDGRVDPTAGMICSFATN